MLPVLSCRFQSIALWFTLKASWGCSISVVDSILLMARTDADAYKFKDRRQLVPINHLKCGRCEARAQELKLCAGWRFAPRCSWTTLLQLPRVLRKLSPLAPPTIRTRSHSRSQQPPTCCLRLLRQSAPPNRASLLLRCTALVAPRDGTNSLKFPRKVLHSLQGRSILPSRSAVRLSCRLRQCNRRPMIVGRDCCEGVCTQWSRVHGQLH